MGAGRGRDWGRGSGRPARPVQGPLCKLVGMRVRVLKLAFQERVLFKIYA
jgi:hypothetical protein